MKILSIILRETGNLLIGIGNLLILPYILINAIMNYTITSIAIMSFFPVLSFLKDITDIKILSIILILYGMLIGMLHIIIYMMLWMIIDILYCFAFSRTSLFDPTNDISNWIKRKINKADLQPYTVQTGNNPTSKD